VDATWLTFTIHKRHDSVETSLAVIAK